MADLTDKEVEILNNELKEMNEAIDKMSDWMNNLIARNKTLPSVRRYIDVTRASMDELALHAVLKHASDPVKAVNDTVNEALARTFLLGIVLGRQGFEPTEMDIVEIPDPAQRDWN